MNQKNLCGTYKKFTPSGVFNQTALYTDLGMKNKIDLIRSAFYSFRQFTKKVIYDFNVIELRKI